MSLKNKRVTYDNIKNIYEEIEHVKEYTKDIKKSIEQNCIMENEKKNFDKMKNEFIKLNADVNIMKEDMKEVMGSLHNILKRINFLEDENKNLRQHNKNLVKFVQNRNNKGNSNMNIQEDDQNEDQYTMGNRTQSKYNQMMRNVNVEQSSPLSELSAFNTVNNSSVEFNNNINNNLERNRSRRFLIPRSDEMKYSHHNN